MTFYNCLEIILPRTRSSHTTRQILPPQHEGESIANNVAGLKEIGEKCNFICNNCKHSTFEKQPKNTPMLVEETRQPSTSSREISTPEGNLSDTTHDPTNVDMASDERRTGDDSADGVPFTM